MYRTTLPQDVEMEMNQLLKWYREQNKNMRTLAGFHARYEAIHPFQDGNGRTGRMILFRECLRHNLSPLIIEAAHRPEYLEALKEYRENGSVAKMFSIPSGTGLLSEPLSVFYGGIIFTEALMNSYEYLQEEAREDGVNVIDYPFDSNRIRGL